MPLDELPAELYSAILSHIPRSSRQRTALALTRALPRAPISQHHLFESVRLVRPHQAPGLYRRLCCAHTEHIKRPWVVPDIVLWIHHLSVESWRVDADVLVNVIHLLSNLETFNLCIGPDNFLPEHLEAAFRTQKTKLKLLALKFSPYVRKATYYQFLKGSYYDSTLRALSAWPSSSLSTLSVVHDPFVPDPSDMISSFAQPLVFFRLDLNLSLFIHSQTSLKNLILRIPGRTIARPLIMEPSNFNPSSDDVKATLSSPHRIEFLDISTCKVSESDVESLLAHFTGLKHLIVDQCPGLLRDSFRPPSGQETSWWWSFGKKCAMAGLKKAKDKEKELKARFDGASRISSVANQENIPINNSSEPRRPRPGRRGLATATFSLRRPGSPLHTNYPVGPTPAVAGDHSQPVATSKIYILPPLPTLRTLALSPILKSSEPMKPVVHQSILADFERGWNDGIRMVWEKRARMGDSFRRESGVSILRTRFMKFRQGVKDSGGAAEDLDDLEDITTYEEGIFSQHNDSSSDLGKVPALCLGGLSADEGRHASGCGHSIAWRINDLQYLG